MACNRFCLCKRQINVLLGICISFQMFLSLSFAHFDAVIFLVDGQEVLCGRRTLPGLGGAHSLQGALGARAAERGSPPVCGQRTLARAARWVHLDLPPASRIFFSLPHPRMVNWEGARRGQLKHRQGSAASGIGPA